MGSGRFLYYSIYFHTKTRYVDNEAYWSLDLSQAKAFTISKTAIANKFKEAQTSLTSMKRQPIRVGKVSKLFILKINSSKFQQILKQGNKV